MTAEYHLACARAAGFPGPPPAKPGAVFAAAADQIQVAPPTVLSLLDAAIAKTTEPDVKDLLVQARGLLA